MNKQSLHNQQVRGNIKNWIVNHSAAIALVAAIWALLRVTGIIDMFFNLFASAQEIEKEITSFGISVIFSTVDIFSLILSAIAIALGLISMKRHKTSKKKGKGGFIIGIICLVISFTPIGTACSLITTAVPVWAKTVYYGLTGQPDKMNEFSEIISSGGVTVDLQEGEYKLDAQIERTEDPAYGTKMKVVGTLTNQTEETWDSASISFVLVDENGQPKEIESYSEAPILEATIKNLAPGQTAEFESRTYPGILETDYDGITDYKVVQISYWKAIDGE